MQLYNYTAGPISSSASSQQSTPTATVTSATSSRSASSRTSSTTSSATASVTPLSCPNSNGTVYSTNNATMTFNFIVECYMDHSGGDMKGAGQYVGSLNDCIGKVSSTVAFPGLENVC